MKRTFISLTLLFAIGAVIMICNQTQAQSQTMRTAVSTPVQGDCFQGYIFDKNYALFPF